MLKIIIDLLFPDLFCRICQKKLTRNEKLLCEECLAKFDVDKQRLKSCGKCATFIPQGEEYCRICEKGKNHNYFENAYSAGVFRDAWQESLHQFKYQGKKEWLDFFVDKLEKTVENYGVLKNIDLIVPVPLAAAKERQRGYNQSDLLARSLARRCCIDYQKNALCRWQDTKSQTGLNRQERIKNMQGVFRLGSQSKILGKNILLVDDVFTTGSTVNACARLIKENRGGKVWVITCAAGSDLF